MVGIFENITPSHVKQLLLDKVLSMMCKGDLILADLCKLFRGCEGDQNQNYLAQVQKTFNSKEMLDVCAMDIDIPELAVKLEWLEVVSRYIRVPRLEAAFASRFMQRLAQPKPFKAQEVPNRNRTYRVRRKLWSIPLKKGFHRFHGLFSLFFIDAHSMFIRSGCHEMGSQCFPNLFFLMGCLSVGMAVGRHFGVCEDGG